MADRPADRVISSPCRFASERLVAARLDLGLTQEEAAQAAGVDVRTYRRYESGEVNGDAGFSLNRASRRSILARLERELGLSSVDLLVPLETAKEVPRATGGTPRGPHALPRPRHAIAREPEETELIAWLTDPGASRLFVVQGLGGAGKTTLVAHALDRANVDAFVWSFYEDSRAESFLAAIAGAFDRGAHDEELGERAARGLVTAGPLLVLDGLETMQVTDLPGRARGELADPRLRRLLRRIARGLDKTRAVVTTRVPLPDLEAGALAVATHELGSLSAAQAAELIHRWGAPLDASTRAALVERAGGHALSAAVLGSWAARVGSADLASLDLRAAIHDDPLAARLARVLEAYGAALSPLDRDVLRRASALSRGVDARSLAALARASGPAAGALAGVGEGALRASLARLHVAGLLARADSRGRFRAHPLVLQHFRRELGDDATSVHAALRRGPAWADFHAHGASPRDRAALDALEEVLEHTLRAGDAEGARELYARALGGFSALGLRLGELSRGLRVLRLFATDAATGEVDPTIVRRSLTPSSAMRVLYDLGLFSGALGDLAAARAAYRSVHEVALEVGDVSFQLTALRTVGYTELLAGDIAASERSVTRSLELAERLASVEDVVRAKALLGAACSSRGDNPGAEALFAEARRLGAPPMARRSLWEAEHALRVGDIQRAVEETTRNLQACRALEWEGHVAHCHALLGLAAVAERRIDDAARELDAALPWTHRSGEVEMMLRVLTLELEIARAREVPFAALLERGRDLASAGGFRAFDAFVQPQAHAGRESACASARSNTS